MDTQNLLDELSDLGDHGDDSASHVSFSSTAYSRASTPCSSGSSCKGSRKRDQFSADLVDEFKLPVFSPDLRTCIRDDSFITTTQRNRLIKEACTALRGYCWEKDKCVTNHDKRSLAKKLYELAPLSLGDPESKRLGTPPEVSIILLIIIARLNWN